MRKSYSVRFLLFCYKQWGLRWLAIYFATFVLIRHLKVDVVSAIARYDNPRDTEALYVFLVNEFQRKFKENRRLLNYDIIAISRGLNHEGFVSDANLKDLEELLHLENVMGDAACDQFSRRLWFPHAYGPGPYALFNEFDDSTETMGDFFYRRLPIIPWMLDPSILNKIPSKFKRRIKENRRERREFHKLWQLYLYYIQD